MKRTEWKIESCTWAEPVASSILLTTSMSHLERSCALCSATLASIAEILPSASRDGAEGLGGDGGGLAEQLLVVDDSADALMQLSSSHSFLLLQF